MTDQTTNTDSAEARTEAVASDPMCYPMETHVYKDARSGWKAKTRVDLGDNWELQIHTHKPPTGGVSTAASVHKRESSTSIVHRVHHDFYAIIWRNAAARCTRKTVEHQHDDVLVGMRALIMRVRAHYADIGEPLPVPPSAG